MLWAAFQEELLLGDSGLHGDVIFFFTVLSRSDPLSPDPPLVVAILQIICPPGRYFWALDEPQHSISFKYESLMASRSSPLAWKIPWTEEAGRLQSMGSQRVGHD